MSSILNIPLNGGYVTTGTGARDPSDLESGELVAATGTFYKKNDPNQVWRIPGRSLFGSAGSGAVKGLAICQFDDGGTDKLIASVGTTLVAATPGVTGTFASLATGLNSASTRLTACHQDDRWYLGNGYDANRCLKPDGTVRLMSMQGPPIALTAATSSAAGVVAFPTASTGSFSNPANAYDGSANGTYASGTLSAAGTVTHTWNTWAANATAGRSLYYNFRLSGLPISGDVNTNDGTIGTGGSIDSGFNVTVLLEKNEGSGWVSLYSSTRTSSTNGISNYNSPVTADSSLLQFRATLTYNSGTSPATLQIYNLATQYGSAVTAFDTTGTMYYAYTEYDSVEDNAGPPSGLTALPAFTGKTFVTLTRGATVNAAATHWRIYRSVPGAAATIDSMGLLATVPISDSGSDLLVYRDTFNQDGSSFQDPTVQLTPLIPAMTVGDLSIPRDTPAPAFLSMISWSGSIVGFSRTNRRTLRYSEAGRPESFPEFYVVSSFPLDEHDGLVGQMAVGETLILLMEGAVLALDDLPRVVDGQFNGADARPLKGHPGCVGNYAYATFSVTGEPRGAWVSPFGVYVTNGQQCACISLDLAWENEVDVASLGTSVLKWDAKNLILWFNFDSDGDGLNDREMPFHMAPTHDKGGNHPKVGQPTEKATSCAASALISSAHYRFSAHPSSGDVFVEDSGTVDDSTGDTVEMVVKTRQIDNDMVTMAIIKGTVAHTDFGTGETCELVSTFYRDTANTQSSRTQNVRLDGNRGTTVGIGRSGELVDFQLTYAGDGDGGIGGIALEIEGQGRSGSATRWVSSSATP